MSILMIGGDFGFEKLVDCSILQEVFGGDGIIS